MLKHKSFWVLPIAVLALVVFILTTAGRQDEQWLANSVGVFAEGAPLHCSGIESMTAAEAIAWLHDRGYERVTVLETRPASGLTWEELPADAELKEVLVGPSDDMPANVYIATTGHPEYGQGYQVEVPPQHCPAS